MPDLRGPRRAARGERGLLIRDPRLSLRDGAVAAWPALDGRIAFAAVRRGARPSTSASRSTRRSRSSTRSISASILHGTGDAWMPLATRVANRSDVKNRRLGRVSSSTRASSRPSTRRSRVSFVYRQRLDHLVDEVPCSACHGSRLRDDAAAVAVRGPHARRAVRLAARRHAGAFQGAEADEGAAAGRRRPAARDHATGCSSSSTSASTT